jgi:uncharacterized repeat protein (TIGR03803 family)
MNSSKITHLLCIALAALAVVCVPRAQAQTESVVYNFLGLSDGQYPVDSVALDSAGNVYGTTSSGGYSPCLGIGCGAAWELSPSSGGWAFDSIHIFVGGSDGAQPLAGFILDARGNLYGTTGEGGNDTDCVPLGPGCGTVVEFSHTPKGWIEKTLATLNGPNTGWYPMANLTMDAAGNLYGTTEYGGSNDFCNGDAGGCGIVFRLSPKTGGGWTETVLHAFHSAPRGSDGDLPFSGVTLDAAGNLYGTTFNGGSSTLCSGFGCGTVYKLSPTTIGPWKETILHTFVDGPDGAFPWGGVILDTKGNLYGTAYEGGDLSACEGQGCGTVFELAPQTNGSWHFQVLHAFEGSDGRTPAAGLTFDSQGRLLGTTVLGGDLTCNNGNGCGTVFRLSHSSTDWDETVVYAFTGNPDGSQPYAAVTEDTSGNIFGTTLYGGLTSSCCGTVFEIKP